MEEKSGSEGQCHHRMLSTAAFRLLTMEGSNLQTASDDPQISAPLLRQLNRAFQGVPPLST